MSQGGTHYRRSYIHNPRGQSYLTNQALRRLRYQHTSIATQNWRPCRIKDTSWTGAEHCPPHLYPTTQAFSLSLAPVNDPTSPITRGWCVSPTRETRVTSSRSSREQRSSGNRYERTLGYQTGSLRAMSYLNMGTTKDSGGNEEWMVVPHGAFLPRRRILNRKLGGQRRCQWTENINSHFDDLELIQDKTDHKRTLDEHKVLPSIVLPQSGNTQASVRQALDVKHVRLQTPPPSPSVRHINIHLPGN